MKKRNTMMVGLFVVIVAVALLVISGRFGIGSTTHVNVRLKWLFYTNYSGAVVARKRGFFPEDWTVDIRPGGFEADSIKLVSSRSDDFGVTSAIELLRARARGVPIVALCADYQMSPVAFLTLCDSGITKVEQWPDRRLGIKYGTNTELLCLAMLDKAGVPQDTLTMIPVKFSTLPLLAQEVDIFPSYYMTDPVNIQAKGFTLNIITPQQYGIECYGNVLFAREDLVRDQPELVRDFVTAYVAGWKWAAEHPQDVAEMFATLNTEVPVENQRIILERTLPYLSIDGSLSSFGQMNKQRWQATLEILKYDAELGRSVDLSTLNISDCFTTQFLPQ